MVTTDHVLVESWHLVRARSDWPTAEAFWEVLESAARVETVRAEHGVPGDAEEEMARLIAANRRYQEEIENLRMVAGAGKPAGSSPGASEESPEEELSRLRGDLAEARGYLRVVEEEMERLQEDYDRLRREGCGAPAAGDGPKA